MFEFDWYAVAYVGAVQLTMLASMVVLYRLRRRAPRACWLGIIAYGGLLLFNSLAVWAGPLLVYQVQTGEVIASLMWQWQVLTLLSAAVQVLTFGALTAAIVSDRAPPATPAEGETEHEGE